jgi:hypothetical protein
MDNRLNTFVRGGDVKETLKIGRKANSIKVRYFEVKGEVKAALDPSSITEEMIIKYNLLKTQNAIKFNLDFTMGEGALETALIILNRDGICREFNDYISELVLKYFLLKRKKGKFKFDETKEPEVHVVWVLVVSDRDINMDLPKAIRNKFQLTFDRTGLDLFYKDQLYRIAPPKDGGLEEDE